MRVLVDFDNVPAVIQNSGTSYVADRILDVLMPAVGTSVARFDLRLYGGWDEWSAMTKKAQKLYSEIVASFPAVRAHPQSHPPVQATVSSELAQSLEALPKKPLQNTFRFRPPARRLVCDDPSTHGCTQTGCPIVALSQFITGQGCPVSGCAITAEMLLRSPGEQKMVDTMIVADLIYLAQIGESPVAVVSSDDDLWPGILIAMKMGCHIIHVETQGTSTGALYTQGVVGRYTAVRM